MSLDSANEASEDNNTNWLDIGVSRKDIPLPVLLARETIRDKLKQNHNKTLSTDAQYQTCREGTDVSSSLPFPNFESREEQISTVDTFFEEARSAVLDHLFLDPEKAPEICRLLKKFNQGTEFQDIDFSPNEVAEHFRTRSVDALQDRVSPQCWRYLIKATMEIQYAQMSVLLRWLKDDQCKNKITALGVDPEHISYLLRFCGKYGKWVDQAFLKQDILHEAEGENTSADADSKIPLKFAYKQESEQKSFSEIFRDEFASMELNKIAIPKNLQGQYPHFKQYITELENALLSQETNTIKAQEMWDNVMKLYLQVYESGCPISIIPYTVPGENGKPDIELRVGIREERYSASEEDDQTRQIAQDIFNGYRNADDNIHTIIPPTISPSNLLSFGISAAWYLDAESGKYFFTDHRNVVERLASQESDSGVILQFMDFSDYGEFNAVKFQHASDREVDAHEKAHGVYNWQDTAVDDRIGLTLNPLLAWIMEETKAETVGAKIMSRKIQSMSDEEKFYQVAAKMAAIIYYVTQKEMEAGGRYSHAVKILLHTLFQKKALVFKDGRFSVKNAEDFFQTLEKKGDEIIKSFYQDSSKSNSCLDFQELVTQAEKDADVQNCVYSIKYIVQNQITKADP